MIYKSTRCCLLLNISPGWGRRGSKLLLEIKWGNGRLR